MEALNRFLVLSGLAESFGYGDADEEVDAFGVLDADDLEALGNLALDRAPSPSQILGGFNAVANPLAILPDPSDADPLAGELDVLVDDPKNPWTVVGPRLRRRNRSTVRQHYIPEPAVKVCELEYVWVPKVGCLREIRKWAQARRSGCVNTPDGLATFIY